MNLASNANRAFRSANNFNQSAVLEEVASATLLLNFLTAHPQDLLPARNVVPYYELPRYISPGSQPLANNSTVTLVSPNFQLNQVPDKLIIFVRKTLAQQTIRDADAFFPIENISINWNNQSGLLSSASKEDLYRYSREAGSNQHYNEFVGKAQRAQPGGGNPLTVATTGSMLMLNFGEHIQLSEAWYAPGSIGSFNLQFSIRVANYSGTNFSAGGYELVLVTMNSGVFVCERGSSSIFTALLYKEAVLNATEKEVYSKSDVQRMVGGGFFDMLKSVASKVAPIAKVLAPSILGEKGKIVSDVIGALGYGQSGAGMSAGGMSAGGRSGAGMSAGRLASRLM